MARELRKRFHRKLIVWEKLGSIAELYRRVVNGTTEKKYGATP